MLFFRNCLITALLFGLALFAPNAVAFTVGNLRYDIQDDGTSVVINKYVQGDEKDIIIPATVTDDENGTTYTVTGIARNAFYNADINSVTLPETIQDIDVYAFWKCKMTSIVFSEGLKRIGYGAFIDCFMLNTVTLPNSVEELGYEFTITGTEGFVFSRCSSLKEVTLGPNIATIYDGTFSGCTALETVNMAEGPKAMGERVFEECRALSQIELPHSIETIGRAAFLSSGLASITFPGSVKIIPNSAFLWCRGLTEFTIEEGVVEVGKQSFAACYGYDKVTVPNSVEWIRSDAFQSADKVTEIRLGTGLRRLGHSALAVWSPTFDTNTPMWSLTDIYCAATVPPVYEPNDEHLSDLDADFFFGAEEFTDELRVKFFNEVTLHVPAEAVDAYRKAEIWKEFANIVADKAPNVTFTTPAADFSGVTVTIDGVPATLEGNNATFDVALGSAIAVAPTESSVINGITATGADITENTDGTYSIITTEVSATVDIDWSVATVNVMAEETYIDGIKAGSLLLEFNGENLASVQLPVGQTVTFVPVAADGYEFQFVANAGGQDAGTSYTAVKDDMDKDMVFKAVFKKNESGLENIGCGMADDTPVTVYSLTGTKIAVLTPATLDQLKPGFYILKIGDSVMKYCR